MSYRTTEKALFSHESILKSEQLPVYDSIDDEVLRSYNEFALASLLFYALKEAACSEQSSRMTAMDAASKNAGEDKLDHVHPLALISKDMHMLDMHGI